MEFLNLKLVSSMLVLLLCHIAGAAVDDYEHHEKLFNLRQGWGKNGLHENHCKTSEEYIKILEFLRKEKNIPEDEARQVALRVSEACSGSANRFLKAFLTMKKAGVSLQKSVDVGLAMVKENPVTIENFYEIFSKMYLNEYFNVNFKASLEIALELSKNFKGDLNMARADFNQFSNFCLDQKKVGLTVNQCAKLAVRFAKLSQYYAKGIYKDFIEVYDLLRDDKRFGLSLIESINITEKILRNGPTGRINFLQAYNYGVSKEGLDLPARNALEFGLSMVKNSYKGGDTPPIFPGEQLLNLASQNDTPIHHEVNSSEDTSER